MIHKGAKEANVSETPMGAREAARLAWRAAVARAAEEWREAEAVRLRNGASWGESGLTVEAWCAARGDLGGGEWTVSDAGKVE